MASANVAVSRNAALVRRVSPGRLPAAVSKEAGMTHSELIGRQEERISCDGSPEHADSVTEIVRKMASYAIAFISLTAHRTFTFPARCLSNPREIFDCCRRDQAVRILPGRRDLGKYFANERSRS
jgi:hypothetical protein